MSKKVLDDVTITVTFENASGYRTYTTTPVDDNPEILSYYINKFLKQWEREKP